jgi:uncharacterized membrane protein
MADTTTLEVMIATYDNETQASTVLSGLKRMAAGGTIDIVDAAAIVRDGSGKVRFEEPGDPTGKTWAKRGAIAGGLVGLIFPPSIIVSAAVAGGAGGLWGKIRDKGFKDDDLKAVGESLDLGSSALIAIVDLSAVDRIAENLENYERLTRHHMSDDATAVVLAEVSTAPA